MLEWIRPPQQARTHETLNRLLDAAEAILSEKGFDATGIAEIAERGGSSVGGFYRRFADKQALLHALHERFCEEARATAEVALEPERWAVASTAEIVPEFVDFLVRTYREREGLLRAFLLRGISDPPVRERTRGLFEFIAAKLAHLLEQRVGEIAHRDPAFGAAFALHVVLGTLNHTVLGPTRFELSDDRISAELTHVFLAYLGVRNPAHQPTTGGHTA